MTVIAARVLFVVSLLSAALHGRATELRHSRNDRRSLIIGGQPVPSPLPYYVHTTTPTTCGGVLLAPNIVLTVAHCAAAFRQTVTIGSLSRTGGGTSGGETLAVESVTLHPQYKAGSFYNDLALVKLQAASVTGQALTYNADEAIPAVDQVATVMGFGSTAQSSSTSISSSTSSFSESLQQAAVPIQPVLQCFHNLGTDVLSEMHICAGSESVDACAGDSGSPMILNGVIIGLVSFGRGCGQEPGVYIRTSPYVQWLDDYVCQYGIPRNVAKCGPAPPTEGPSPWPTSLPTLEPTVEPTLSPTLSRTPTAQPTTATPTQFPTFLPTDTPTLFPTDEPTHEPTLFPTDEPTVEPTYYPTDEPSTAYPTHAPTTAEPTVSPTNEPTYVPTAGPTTVGPTAVPTWQPTGVPTTLPPTRVPTTLSPTTQSPTTAPSPMPVTAAPYASAFTVVGAMEAEQVRQSWQETSSATTNGGGGGGTWMMMVTMMVLMCVHYYNPQ